MAVGGGAGGEDGDSGAGGGDTPAVLTLRGSGLSEWRTDRARMYSRPDTAADPASFLPLRLLLLLEAGSCGGVA